MKNALKMIDPIVLSIKYIFLSIHSYTTKVEVHTGIYMKCYDCIDLHQANLIYTNENIPLLTKTVNVKQIKWNLKGSLRFSLESIVSETSLIISL